MMKNPLFAATMATLVLLAATPTQAEVTPGALYDFRANNNQGHPDSWTNLGTLGGSLGVQGTTPALTLDFPGYYEGINDFQTDDGSYDILTPDSGGVSVPDGFSYELYLRRTGDAFGNEHQISAAVEEQVGAGGAVKKIFFGLHEDDPTMVDWQIFSEGSSVPGGGAEIKQKDMFPLPIDEWVHFIVTFDDATDIAMVYVNGLALLPFRFTGIELNADPGNKVTLFKWRGTEGPDRSFNGDISQARLYDFVLSGEQVEANYLEVVPTLAGDFDVDNDVDGFDFLAWQRGFGSIYDSNDLADWEGNFGTVISPVVAAAATSAAVPEPTSLVLLVLGGLLAGDRDKKDRHNHALVVGLIF